MGKLGILFLAIFGCHYTNAQVIESCDSKIYCQGQLLDIVQRAHPFNDSKTFVDLAQKNSPEVTLQNFQALLKTSSTPTKTQILNFLKENFEKDNELVPWTPSDFNENPDFLTKIDDANVKEFAKNLIAIWPTLAKKVNDSVNQNPDRHSLIPLPNGFIIPGGRFAEVYYWDTYWIIKGLLISGMTDTARGMIENLLSLVTRYGFVPNGSRVYYLNRSQPPLLSLMAGLYIDYTNNKTWLSENVDTLEQELNWWLENRTVTVNKPGFNGKLAHYSVNSPTPRPESYNEDLVTCSIFQDKQREECYKNLKSAAESGWDFSSRWFFKSDGSISSNLSQIDTPRVIPVELNSFLCAAFRQLSRFYGLLGNVSKSQQWLIKHNQWKSAIQRVFYHCQDGIWYDWDNSLNKHRRGFYPSNFAPLAAEAYDVHLKKLHGKRAVKYLEKNKIESFQGGIPTSLLNSTQQWDFPNAWPPLQDLIVMGLKNTNNKVAIEKAQYFANETLRAFMKGYATSKEMFEKYDANVIGQYGGGGEYTVQSGFGWTNGVALSFIEYLYVK